MLTLFAGIFSSVAICYFNNVGIFVCILQDPATKAAAASKKSSVAQTKDLKMVYCLSLSVYNLRLVMFLLFFAQWFSYGSGLGYK